ncbi:hypothetical protein EYF80_012896 [Liparis tanakae]|uniref:Uncharacterized protein n=1 Tax=Liparis tanakae TaxID=230148 RepID=A0A4Z2II23_9TELE|nr:hypothetical protein EYF80_012896 [Liparis tanakae]
MDSRGGRLKARTKRTKRTPQQEWPLRGKTGRKEDTWGKEGTLKGRNVQEHLMSLLYRIILGILLTRELTGAELKGAELTAAELAPAEQTATVAEETDIDAEDASHAPAAEEMNLNRGVTDLDDTAKAPDPTEAESKDPNEKVSTLTEAHTSSPHAETHRTPVKLTNPLAPCVQTIPQDRTNAFSQGDQTSDTEEEKDYAAVTLVKSVHTHL